MRGNLPLELHFKPCRRSRAHPARSVRAPARVPRCPSAAPSCHRRCCDVTRSSGFSQQGKTRCGLPCEIYHRGGYIVSFQRGTTSTSVYSSFSGVTRCERKETSPAGRHRPFPCLGHSAVLADALVHADNRFGYRSPKCSRRNTKLASSHTEADNGSGRCVVLENGCSAVADIQVYP